MTMKAPVSSRCLLTVVSTGVVSLLAQVVGVLSPVWVLRRAPGVTVSEGVWYARACPSFHVCVLSSRQLIRDTYMVHVHEADHNRTGDIQWTEYQVESSVAIALTMAACVCFLLAFVHRLGNMTFVSRALTFGCLALLAASIMMLLVVVRVAKEDLYVIHPTERWSLNTAGLGGVIGFAGTVLPITACYKIFRNERNARGRDDEYVPSAGAIPTPLYTVPAKPPIYSRGNSSSDAPQPPRYEDIYLPRQEEMVAAL